MRILQKKSVTFFAVLLGILVLSGTAFFFQAEIRERYWLWRLEVGDNKEKLEILKKLEESGSVLFIPKLMELTATSLEAQNWVIGFNEDLQLRLDEKRKYLTEFQIIFTLNLNPDPQGLSEFKDSDYPIFATQTVDVLKGIKSREAQEAVKILRGYLEDPEVGKRWSAALSLFDTREKLEQYLPKENLLPKTTSRF